MEGYGHVAHLAAGPGGPGHDAPVADDAAPHAGAHGEQHQIPAALAGALPRLAQGGQVGVVGRLDGHARPAGQLLGHIQILPAQVDAQRHQRLVHHRAGHAHPRAHADTVGEGLHHLAHVAGDVVKGGVHIPEGGELPLVQQVPFPAHQPQLDGGSPYVDAKTDLSHSPDLLQKN